MVVANCLKNRPEMPEMKAVGMKTAQSVSAMAISAAGHLVHRLVRGFARRHAESHVALDVLDYDDGIVDNDAHGQHQAEQRQVVDRDAERMRGSKKRRPARPEWRPPG